MELKNEMAEEEVQSATKLVWDDHVVNPYIIDRSLR